MPTSRPRRAPLWFVVLTSAVFALLLRELVPPPLTSRGGGTPDGPPALAFWFVFILIAEAIWKGVEVAGKITLVFLQYSVTILWKFARLIAEGAFTVGKFAWKGLKVGWGLMRDTYTHVLKPAVKFLWKWVDKTERWFERTFGPLMKWLRRLRTWVLDFYKNYIRPFLDIIDVTRRALRVLGSLGLDWARALDAKLGAIEEAIDRPVRWLVAQLNEIINVVNRVVTADGLFQRSAYIRTLARDYKQAWNELAWGYHRPITAARRAEVAASFNTKSWAEIIRDIKASLSTHSGADAALIGEVATTVRARLRTP